MKRSTESAGDRVATDASAESDGEQPPEPDEPAHYGQWTGSVDPASVEIVTRPALAVRPDVAWLRAHLQAAADMLERPVARVHVTIADDRWVTELNRRHLGVDGITDVLSFPDEDDRERVQADIVICADEAARQARRRGHSVERELLLYALHGLLHCAGYDDQDPAGFQTMHAEEDRLLEAIGVGRTFDHPAENADAGEGGRSCGDDGVEIGI